MVPEIEEALGKSDATTLTEERTSAAAATIKILLRFVRFWVLLNNP